MIQTILLGVVQGLSEFLPISSSGHLVLLQRLFGMAPSGILLEVVLHTGSLIAVVCVFWKDIWAMLLHPVKNPTLRMLVLATVPAVVLTLLLGDTIEGLFSGWFLGVAFLVTAGLLFASDAFPKSGKRARSDLSDVTVKQALTMGCLQAFALLPGVSRSGSTIVGGLASGVERETAVRFSFLMGAVAIVGSLVFKAKDLLELGASAFDGGMTTALVGLVAATVSSFFAIRFMLKLIRRVSLKWFGVYTAILGILILVDQLLMGVVFEKIV